MQDAKSQTQSLGGTLSLLVGLTGGIACGKSNATRVFAELGAHVLDADQIAHEAIRAGQPAFTEIVDYFGRDITNADGEIDRKRLGKIIFSDVGAREKLNAIVHPRVIAEQERLSEDITARCGSCIIIVDAALMIEAGSYKRFEKLIVVHCKPELQLHRLMVRDGLTLAEAQERIATQMPLSEKLKLASYVVETSGTYRQTRSQIVAIHNMLLQTLFLKMSSS
jgi:dephospho-CoA kinase